jgi:hypothetical protein
MNNFDFTTIGAFGLLIPVVVLLIVLLYIVPIPLWIAAVVFRRLRPDDDPRWHAAPACATGNCR